MELLQIERQHQQLLQQLEDLKIKAADTLEDMVKNVMGEKEVAILLDGDIESNGKVLNKISRIGYCFSVNGYDFGDLAIDEIAELIRCIKYKDYTITNTTTKF